MSESKTLRQKVQKEEGGEGEWVGCSRCPVPGGWVGGAVGSGEFGDPGGGQGRRWGSPAPLGRRGSALYTGLPWELMGREGDTALLGCLPPRSAGSLWGARPGAGAPGLPGGLLPQAAFQRRILPAFLPLRFPSLLSSLHPFLSHSLPLLVSGSGPGGGGRWAGSGWRRRLPVLLSFPLGWTPEGPWETPWLTKANSCELQPLQSTRHPVPETLLSPALGSGGTGLCHPTASCKLKTLSTPTQDSAHSP